MIWCPPRLACASLRDEVQKPSAHVKYEVVCWYLTQAEQGDLSHGLQSSSPCVLVMPVAEVPVPGTAHLLPFLLEKEPAQPSACVSRGCPAVARGATPKSAPTQGAWVENRLLPTDPLAEPPGSLLLIAQVRKGNEDGIASQSNEDGIASHAKPFYCDRAFPHQELHTQTPGSGFSKCAKSPQRPVPTSPEFKHVSWQSWEYFLICFFFLVGIENIKFFFCVILKFYT